MYREHKNSYKNYIFVGIRTNASLLSQFVYYDTNILTPMPYNHMETIDRFMSVVFHITSFSPSAYIETNNFIQLFMLNSDPNKGNFIDSLYSYYATYQIMLLNQRDDAIKINFWIMIISIVLTGIFIIFATISEYRIRKRRLNILNFLIQIPFQTLEEITDNCECFISRTSLGEEGDLDIASKRSLSESSDVRTSAGQSSIASSIRKDRVLKSFAIYKKKRIKYRELNDKLSIIIYFAIKYSIISIFICSFSIISYFMSSIYCSKVYDASSQILKVHESLTSLITCISYS